MCKIYIFLHLVSPTKFQTKVHVDQNDQLVGGYFVEISSFRFVRWYSIYRQCQATLTIESTGRFPFPPEKCTRKLRAAVKIEKNRRRRWQRREWGRVQLRFPSFHIIVCVCVCIFALDRQTEMRFQFAKEYRGAGSIEWLDSIASRAIPRSGERNIF